MPPSFKSRRSLLFVPGDRPDRFVKALATGADSVCVDLEDGVGFRAKDDARTQAIKFLLDRSPTGSEVILRINDANSDLGRRDLDVLVRSGAEPDALMLPKVSDPDEVRHVETILRGEFKSLPLIVLIESAAGVACAREIGMASDNVAALFFGGIDFSADVGCVVEWDALLHARSEVVMAAALAGVSAIDSPCMDVPAVKELAEESRRVRRLGFVGKAAIHPTQVSVIQKVFSPTPEEVVWARRILEAYEKNNGGVLLVEGQLIERPVITAAQRMLQMAIE